MKQEDKSLIVRATGGIVFLMIMLCIFLFAAAGTFSYWQAWIWILIFVGSSALITVFLIMHDKALLKRRLGAGPDHEKEPVQKKIIGMARIIFVAILVLPGLDHRFSWSHVPIWLVVTGDVFARVGFYIVYLVFKANSFTSAVIEIAQDQKVISSGPYKFVRHPMYSGALLMLVFAPLALGSFWGMLFIIPFAFIIAWRLKEEEKFLKENLPGYSDYARKTIYRLVPWFW